MQRYQIGIGMGKEKLKASEQHNKKHWFPVLTSLHFWQLCSLNNVMKENKPQVLDL